MSFRRINYQILLYSIWFHKLFPLFANKYGTSPENSFIISPGCSFSHAITRHFIKLEDELIDIIKNSNKNQVSENYDKILSFQIDKSWYMGNKLVEITKEIVLSIYLTLGVQRIIDIAKLFFTDPFAYQKGWPDLTIIEKDEIKFIEVKGNDRLRRSQIITMCDLIKSTDLDISVLKIV